MMTKLEKMLKYVSEHNEFYKNRIKEYGIKDPLDITQWPVLTRKELQENRYNMFSDGYKSKYFNQQLRRQSSSGSSGVPVNVYWDYKDWYASNMSLWRKRLQWYEIHPSDKYVMFTLNAFNLKSDGESVYHIKEPANILSINVSLIQNDSGYDKLVDIINEFEPKWLYIQPFVLNKLIQAYKRTEKAPPITLKYIESVGELLASDLRRRAVEFFEVPLANMYGSEEMNGIALENQVQQMQILSDNIYVEIMKESIINDFGEGEIIVTNLKNFAMPLIRYNQGDQILIRTFTDEKDPLTIDLINGRSYTAINRFEREIPQLLLVDIISEVNNIFFDSITAFHYIFYQSKRLLQCHILIDKNHKTLYPSLKKAIEHCFYKKVSFPSSCNFTVVLDIEEQYKHKKNNIIEFME